MKISRKFIRMEATGLIVLFIGSFLILFIFDGTEMFSSFSRFFKGWSFGAVFGFCFWQGNYFIAKTAGERLDWRKNAKKANTTTLLLLFIYGVLVSIGVPFIYNKYVFHIPSDRLYGYILGGSFTGLTIDFAIVGVYYSGFLAKYWMQSIKNEEQLKQENLIAKYEALKNQVNPHFLFNSLNTLTGIVERDSKLATRYIKKLSDIYRYVLEQKDKETVRIPEELQFVEDYIYLQKMRYGTALNFVSNVQDSDGLVAPLALQMLIENAIKHNVIADDQPLNIELSEEDGYYILKNNMQKKKTMQQNAQIGLDNLLRRYELLSNRKPEIKEDAGEFVVRLPVIKTDK
ncbi:MAG: histidine kinase [Bacteroidales bacterium]|nr:histidine kinase [Bacteroidales bacterium]